MFKTVERSGCILLVFPHPSGVSHFWNSPANIARASRELQRYLKYVTVPAPPQDQTASKCPGSGSNCSRSQEKRKASAVSAAKVPLDHKKAKVRRLTLRTDDTCNSEIVQLAAKDIVS